MSLLNKLTTTIGASAFTVIIIAFCLVMSVLSWVVGLFITVALVFTGAYVGIKSIRDERQYNRVIDELIEEEIRNTPVRKQFEKEETEVHVNSKAKRPKSNNAALNKERDLYDPRRYTVKSGESHNK